METHLLLLQLVWIGSVWVESLGIPSCLVPPWTRTRFGVQFRVKEFLCLGVRGLHTAEVLDRESFSHHLLCFLV